MRGNFPDNPTDSSFPRVVFGLANTTYSLFGEKLLTPARLLDLNQEFPSGLGDVLS